jgi:hypothetical protein
MNLFDNCGEFLNEAWQDRCDNIVNMIHGHLDRLADCGADSSTLRAYVQCIITDACAAADTVLFNRAMDIAEQGLKEVGPYPDEN